MAGDVEATAEGEAQDAEDSKGREARVAWLASSATLLAACGGGGGSSGSSRSPSPNPPGNNPNPNPVPNPDPDPDPDPEPDPDAPRPADDVEAARFLLQAQFAVTDEDLDTLKADGYEAWLRAKYRAPLEQTGVAWLDSRGYNAIKEDQSYFWPQFGDFMIWNQLLTAPDQMRKRMALALSEYFVVSLNPIDGFWPPYMIAAYWDLLVANAFGNFRELLEKITLNAAMGFFLNTKGNLKEDPASGRQPDENYAREVMQLFTIGLYELNPDGTLKLDDSGNPIETYGQEDVTNLARVFTGYDYDYSRVKWTQVDWHDYAVPSTEFAIDPMRFKAEDHSNLEVRFLGTTIPANTDGQEALRIALDTLSNHPNVGPFFAKQMIQRLVTSNPSPAYVQRVASAFADNGSGVRGDLRAVWTAILMDEEARRMPEAGETLRGKLREPIVRFVQWARTVGITSTNNAYAIYDLSRSDVALGQSPLRSPSVFNFFRPGYVPPNTAIAANEKAAPEFQLHNETTTAGYINFMQGTIRWGYNDVRPTYAALLPIAHDVPAVVRWLNLRLCANQLSNATVERIEAALQAVGVTEESTQDSKLNLLAGACLLILSSPQYLIQK